MQAHRRQEGEGSEWRTPREQRYPPSRWSKDPRAEQGMETRWRGWRRDRRDEYETRGGSRWRRQMTWEEEEREEDHERFGREESWKETITRVARRMDAGSCQRRCGTGG